MIRNLPLILLVCTITSLTSTTLLAQQSQASSAQHLVIIETRSFSIEEVQLVQEKLNQEGPFTIQEKCPQLGLLAIAVPVSASLRINTIEEIAISSVALTLNNNADVNRTRNAKSVATCSDQ